MRQWQLDLYHNQICCTSTTICLVTEGEKWNDRSKAMQKSRIAFAMSLPIPGKTDISTNFSLWMNSGSLCITGIPKIYWWWGFSRFLNVLVYMYIQIVIECFCLYLKNLKDIYKFANLLNQLKDKLMPWLSSKKSD